jgi:gamma-glutamyltranspeptidase/glutathione hydrolase
LFAIMNRTYDRREMLCLLGGAAAAASCKAAVSASAAEASSAGRQGLVLGHPTAARIGNEMLAAGGNAVDAAVAAALAAGVVAVPQCGIGGYGGHMVIAQAESPKVIAVDFNSAAPAAAHQDMFPLDEQGRVRARINEHGWLAAGVPGTLAGMQLALDHYGTRSFREVVAPAIHLAAEGFPVSKELAATIGGAKASLAEDPASRRLLLPEGQPLRPGALYRNADLAKLLEMLARRNSVESFYRGDVARHIADESKKHGGLLTADDLAAYQAREVQPLQCSWHGCMIYTAPLTAGGISVFQAIGILKDLQRRGIAGILSSPQARLEALRIAWQDRLRLLGDPEKVEVPVGRLLSDDYIRAAAERVAAAVRERKPLPGQAEPINEGGTVHLSAVDSRGNMAAVTLTHGNSFGARITIDGLGLILGHGMSRFEPRPGHPNCPGPGKRPLNNMCPTVVLRDGRPVLALGGHGGRRIPDAIFDVLVQYLGAGRSLEQSVAAPRMHTEGGLTVELDAQWQPSAADELARIGYQVQRRRSAVVNAVCRDPQTGEFRGATR